MLLKIVCRKCQSCGLTSVVFPTGVRVLCADCDGKGYVVLEAELFTERKLLDFPISGVYRIGKTMSASYDIQNGRPVSYEDFLGGKLPD